MGPVDSLALRMLAHEGIARPMSVLDACRRFEVLVVQGLAIELDEEHDLFRRFMLSENGRKLAADLAITRSRYERSARADRWRNHQRPALRRRHRAGRP